MISQKVLKIIAIACASLFVLFVAIDAVLFYRQQAEWRRGNAEFEELSKAAAALTLMSASEKNSLAGYKVEEFLGTTCQEDKDCRLPFDYALQSRCAFVAKCISGGCAVVCPDEPSAE